MDGGEKPQPGGVFGDDAGHLGLLEHEFGDEDGVGGRVTTPWQVAVAFRGARIYKASELFRSKYGRTHEEALPLSPCNCYKPCLFL